MQEVVIDLSAEVVSIILLGVAGSILGVAGFLMENLAFTNLFSGVTVIGLWYLYMGTLALYVAVYLIGFRELPARIASVWAMVSN